MYNFEQYASNKNELINRIETVKAKIAELAEMGIDVSEAIRKMWNAQQLLNSDKISIVLVGAFSDGKTSVAAGWLNEKLDNMKIDSDESSDEILCYTPSSIPQGCQIVDTPGLFGDKVGSDENGGSIALSEKTKKYISEANMILYVVTAKNPIKDSHKESIRWILKDLNKLSSTIFVINRMDDVADMTDDEDYAKHAQIKSENLRSKLLDCGLTAQEAAKVKIACISAAPNGKGIEEWKEYREAYLKRSRLSSLEAITNEVLQNSRQHLLVKTGCDILNDEVTKILNKIHEEVGKIETVLLPEQKETLRRNESDLNQLKTRLLQSRGEIKDELRVLEKKKINMIRSATIESFQQIMEDEIGIIPGREGYRLNDDINRVFETYCAKHSDWTEKVSKAMEGEYAKQYELVESLFSKGTDALAKGLQGAKHISPDLFKKGIFAGRDLLGKLGKTIKFKPWQVTKMANFASKSLPVIGAGISLVTDIAGSVGERKRSREFEENKADIIRELGDLFITVNDSLKNEDQYFNDFAPEYNELVNLIEEEKKVIASQEQLLQSFNTWETEFTQGAFRVV